MAERTVTYRVPEGISPERLDRHLAAQEFPQLSRTKIQQLIDEGKVLVDGKAVPSRFKLEGGEEITLRIPPPPPAGVTAEPIPLEILYQDEHLAVVNKPAGMVTHPAPGNRSGTLVNALLHQFGKLSAGGGEDRPGIVHRLDKDTTGLLLVAKNDQAHRALQAAIAARQVRRTYLALVCGHMVSNEGIIDAAIGRSVRDRKKMAIVAGGREAVTHYRLIERYRSYDLLDVDLQTGRTHQIRVHLAHLGHPVFGDPEYGGREKWLRGAFAPERPLARRMLGILTRQALHARAIQFAHPVSGENISLTAPVPPDFAEILAILAAEGR